MSVAENTPFVQAYVEVEEARPFRRAWPASLIRTFIYGSEIGRLNDTKSWKGRADGTIGGAIFDAGPHSFYLLKMAVRRNRERSCLQEQSSSTVSEVEDKRDSRRADEIGRDVHHRLQLHRRIPWGERLEIYGSEGSLIRRPAL